MNAYGLSQTVKEPTHKAGHIIDHIYFNEFQLEIEHDIVSETLGLTTDHFPLIFKLPSPVSKDTNGTVTYRKLKDIDLGKFIEDLQDSYNAIDFADMNFKDMYSEYDVASRLIVDRHGPLVTRKQVATPIAWMDAEYRESRAKRRKYERIWKKNRTEENRNNYIPK